MNREFVPYNLAIEMKAIGFDEPCFGEYHNGDYDITDDEIDLIPIVFENIKGNWTSEHKCCTAPLYQQAARFLYVNSNKQINFQINGKDSYKKLCKTLKKAIKDFRNLQNSKS